VAASACKKQGTLFCDQDLTGRWVKASNEQTAFRLSDRNGVVIGELFQTGDPAAAPASVGMLPAPAPGQAPWLLRLQRTRETIAGTIHAIVRTPSGKRCPAEFALEVLECRRDQLSMHAQIGVQVSDDCTPRSVGNDGAPLPQHVTEFTLLRRE
jgi:hypothetical protein